MASKDITFQDIIAHSKYARKFIVYALVGIAIRLCFMPVTLHDDLLWIHAWPSKMPYQGVFDIYGYLKDNFSTTIIAKGTNYYPPLIYFTLGFFHAIFKNIVPGLGQWLNSYIDFAVSRSELNYLELFKIPFFKLAAYIALLKIPYSVCDFFCSMLLVRSCKTMQDALKAFSLWALSPVIIFGSYIFGQFDIIITTFLLLGYYLITKSRYTFAMFMVGISILFKPSFLVLLLPLSIMLGRDGKGIAKAFLVSLAPIIIVMLPFLIHNGSFMISALVPKFVVSASSDRIDTIELYIGKLIFMVGYAYTIVRLIQRRKVACDMADYSWRNITGILLLSYLIVYTSIHYFQWVIPFLVIGIVNRKISPGIYALLTISLFLYAINSPWLSGRLFLPLNPDFFYHVRSFPEFMKQFIEWGIVMRLAKIVFYACCLRLVYKLIVKPEVINA